MHDSDNILKPIYTFLISYGLIQFYIFESYNTANNTA